LLVVGPASTIQNRTTTDLELLRRQSGGQGSSSSKLESISNALWSACYSALHTTAAYLPISEGELFAYIIYGIPPFVVGYMLFLLMRWREQTRHLAMYRKMLSEIFKAKDPSRMKDVDAILAAYHGSYDLLEVELYAKYGET
jgi:hypothetical protein